MKNLAIFAVIFVSNIFKSLGLRACRYSPTCSRYSIEAFQRFGFLRAAFLSAKRLLSCHPFSPGGYDPLAPDTTLTPGVRVKG